MPIETAIQKLYALREVLDRIAETDNTLYEVISHHVETATALTDEVISELTGEDEETE